MAKNNKRPREEPVFSEAFDYCCHVPVPCHAWLEFWEGKTGKTADHCGATDCTVKGRSNLVGAHVKKVGVGDDSHYITPLCKGCNNRNDEFNVDTELVHAESR